MNSTWDKQTRLEGAKEVLLQAMEKFKGVPNIEIALRIYGHQTPITNNTQDCNDTKLEVPFSSGNIDQIKNKIHLLQQDNIHQNYMIKQQIPQLQLRI